MIATKETAPQITPLTFETLLNRLEESDKTHIFGNWLLRDTFLINSLLYSGEMFIDWENNRANLDSDEFIKLLEIAAALPGEPIYDSPMVGEIKRLHDGEQLLYSFDLHSAGSFQHFKGMLGENIVVIGMPTPTGGRHVIKPMMNIGININSPHQEAAWSFIRRLLLPDRDFYFGLPLRIDEFEKRIVDFMTPLLFWDEDDPESGAKKGDPRAQRVTYGVTGEDLIHEEVTYYLHALTEEEADVVREIIKSADMFFHYDEVIAMIVAEDSQSFFAGNRTAEDTARIIQNRVQTYLNERR